MTHTEEEGNTEAQVISVTIEASGGDTKTVKKSAYEGETEVDEVVGKGIKRSKSYNIEFQIGVIISHEEIK